jgi:hypothetical protein
MYQTAFFLASSLDFMYKIKRKEHKGERENTNQSTV